MFLTMVSFVLVLVTLPFSLCVTVKVVQEYERAVVFRLGRLRSGGAKGPGLFFVMPCVDSYKKVGNRIWMSHSSFMMINCFFNYFFRPSDSFV